MKWLLEKLQWYDVQVTLTLNPLNWECSNEKYCAGLRGMHFGPVGLMLYYG